MTRYFVFVGNTYKCSVFKGHFTTLSNAKDYIYQTKKTLCGDADHAIIYDFNMEEVKRECF